MTTWKELLNGDPLPWLLEEDKEQPGVRYFALREILGLPPEDAAVKKARVALMKSDPVAAIMANQSPEGYWVKPGAGYGPKYQGTVWSIIFLAQLGADGSDPRVHLGGEYLLAHSIASRGGFSPSGFGHCLAGNLGTALIDLGWLGDKRLQKALELMARMVTGDGIADSDDRENPVRFYKSGTCAPLFACAANNKQPCAWGAVKVMLALGKVPPARRTPPMKAAIEQGTGFLLGRDPVVADYPAGWAEKPSSSWFKFGFPLGYVTDVLQNLEALVSLGLAGDERLANALEMVSGKQDGQGRWKMEYSYDGKMWVDIEQKGKPSKWVTLRALRVLKAAYPD